VAGRELVVLGTASQAPTRHRNHNGYLLRWDEEAILFDPGEGTQRQMILAGVSSPSITRICITHFHGDHCLGLPGVLQRMSLDRSEGRVDVYFPSSGSAYFERLRGAAIFDDRVRLDVYSLEAPFDSVESSPFRVVARSLDHRVPTIGWRLEEPDSRRMLPDRLDEAGLRGPEVGRLQREGEVVVDGRRIALEDVSAPRRGQVFAFVMDTRLCDEAFDLAQGADMLVCESTFLRAEEKLAYEYGHLTAAQAARIASESGTRRLVLSHFSQRHPDESTYLEEAAEVFSDVVVARDLDVIVLPARREVTSG
jgi:ribonuclease Z